MRMDLTGLLISPVAIIIKFSTLDASIDIKLRNAIVELSCCIPSFISFCYTKNNFLLRTKRISKSRCILITFLQTIPQSPKRTCIPYRYSIKETAWKAIMLRVSDRQTRKPNVSAHLISAVPLKYSIRQPTRRGAVIVKNSLKFVKIQILRIDQMCAVKTKLFTLRLLKKLKFRPLKP